MKTPAAYLLTLALLCGTATAFVAPGGRCSVRTVPSMLNVRSLHPSRASWARVAPRAVRVAAAPYAEEASGSLAASPARLGRGARTALVLSAMAAAALLTPGPVSASGLGKKVAGSLTSATGLPDAVVLMLLSAMPVIELRGGIPVGIWMGLGVPKTLALCVVGNMLPIAPLLLALRSKLVQRVLAKPLAKARAKAGALGNEKEQWLGLATFVGVPLPGTGAWTGAMGAFLLGMPFWKAMSSIFCGVVSAGLIMSAVTLAGLPGLAFVVAVLAGFLVVNLKKA